MDYESRRPLGRPCEECGCTFGTITESGPHYRLDCEDCGRYVQFVTKADLGLSVKPMTLRGTIKPGKRKRIFQRGGYRCELCGVAPPNAVLEIGHIISVKDATERGLPRAEVDAEDNLFCECAVCNAGWRGESLAEDLAERLRRKWRFLAELERIEKERANA